MAQLPDRNRTTGAKPKKSTRTVISCLRSRSLQLNRAPANSTSQTANRTRTTEAHSKDKKLPFACTRIAIPDVEAKLPIDAAQQ